MSLFNLSAGESEAVQLQQIRQHKSAIARTFVPYWRNIDPPEQSLETNNFARASHPSDFGKQ